MSQPGHAVFLSYAHEDAPAARHIAEALRAAGIEVWFDQSELRGGDSWDAKLRGQIKTCALFLPIVSQNTEERSEGYFRREWKLAVDRTHDMAGGRTFLVPVAIDNTSEAGAAVPEEFARYQWVRLPGGTPTPEFVAQVKHLLETPRKHPALKPSLPRPPTLPPELKQAAQARAAAAAAPFPPKKSMLPFALAVGLGAVAISASLAFYVMRRDQSAATPPAAVATQPAPATPSAPAIADKSIAVLPFTNMSDNKDNAFFADGVHEDLLTNLAKIAELKVISRTSVMEYRDTKKKIQQIATELGVAYVLEGSVRRNKDAVRITVQLIDGRTGAHVLAPDPYDRNLSDIFAIQSEVAQNIAVKLQAALSPGTKAALDRAPTSNLAAYDLYLKAREVADAETDRRTRIARALPLFEGAVQQVPKFALAWLGIAQLHLTAYTANGFDPSEARRAQVKAALDRAVELDPDNVAIISLLGNYYIDARDFTRAAEQGARLSRLYPNHGATFHLQARLATRQDRPDDALANYFKAKELDPRNPTSFDGLTSNLWIRRRYDEADKLLREAIEVLPGNNSLFVYRRALVAFDARGSTTEMEAELAKIPPEARRTDPAAIGRLANWALLRGNADEVIRLWEQSGPNWRMPAGSNDQLAIATAFVVKGQLQKARPILEKERERLSAILASRRGDGNAWLELAMTHALLGEKQAALEVREKMLTAAGMRAQFNEAVFQAWIGDKDKALAELASRLPVSSGNNTVSVNRLRRSLYYQPLQGDPKFEAILNDPKNNAPLF